MSPCVRALALAIVLLAAAYRYCNGALPPTSEPKPNIVIIFADDLGYGDLSVYGHPTSSTPHLDKMAAEGLRFTQFYTASPVCSPSRAALLTGRYQTRSGIYPNVLRADSIGGLPPNETTLAESLKEVGYSSAIVGKWHLGVGTDHSYLPTNHGFDYYMGVPYSTDMCPCFTCFYPNVSCAPSGSHESCDATKVACPLFENTTIIQQPADLLMITENYLKAATSFIKTKAVTGPSTFTNSSIQGPFGDSLSELDWGVGQVFEALKDAEADSSTFVFFTSDNGPALSHELRGGNAGLLRCGKATTWEGGQRVPAIAWWPGRIKPGTTQELAATVDIFPTVSNLVGAKLPEVVLDGVDMSSILFENAKSKRTFYIYYPNDPDPKVGIYAVRVNQYKAHYHSHGGLCPDTHPDIVCRGNYSLHTYDPPLLYDLNSDPSEIYNLDVTEFSDVMATINKVKKEFESGMVWGKSQMDRGTSPQAEPCAIPGCSPFPNCCRTN